jgi:hypothetical protein
MWKEVVLTQFDALFRYFPWLRKTIKYLSQGNRSLSRDLNTRQGSYPHSVCLAAPTDRLSLLWNPVDIPTTHFTSLHETPLPNSVSHWAPMPRIREIWGLRYFAQFLRTTQRTAGVFHILAMLLFSDHPANRLSVILVASCLCDQVPGFRRQV